jgi:hypothetical protein
MGSTSEELTLARKAKVAIEEIGTKPREKIVKSLRKASVAARGATSDFSCEVALKPVAKL